MRALVEQGMRDGAFGLSTGLFYVPGIFTPLSEVVELEKVAGRLGGVHTSHMRDEASRVQESVRETIAIGEQGGLPTQVSHHKVIGKGNWGKSVETLKLIDEARSRGVEDLVRSLGHPATMIASDGEVPIFGRGAPHPRSYGTFARVLAVYVRDKGILTLEEAVRKMSSFPAARIGLADRGVLRPGMKADVAVFDPARVRDAATFEKPHQYAAGFAYVIVNGQVVYENGAMTAARPGRVLYGPAKSQK